ncbi:pilus retraction ATPase, PilT [Haloferula helveola]|uniref:Pilus retraction ATPase, PilT n=1 Tax=Haloferula helveola TaxID=490095 RepID=A0ABM7R7I1_9BACT|nr:pilus retraction ATPase, PilT [Haloferula helveola]
MSEAKEITDYLRETVELGGSDLHLSAWAPPAARVSGSLKPLEDFLFDPETVGRLIDQTLSEAQRTKLESELELDYALALEGVGRFRGNVHVVRGGHEAAFRFIPEEIPELDNLGHHDVVGQICQLRRGLVLVTGITGSGKTTTLAAMIRRISETRSGVIVTIEDPIEYVFSHNSCLIKQREVGHDTKGFPVALRQALRQDPDVIVVSELRDLETIRIALTAAETGHLVLATLHTLDAPQSIDRLVDVFPADQQAQIITQLAGVLEGIISQRLIPRADGQGRILASEVLRANHGIRACIREKKFEQIVGLMEIAFRDGNRTIDQSIMGLLQAGYITADEALLHARERKNFE